jgi:hypothetical protein
MRIGVERRRTTEYDGMEETDGKKRTKRQSDMITLEDAVTRNAKVLCYQGSTRALAAIEDDCNGNFDLYFAVV